MRSIFRYPGGKTKAAAREFILGNRPDRIQEYREPFVGGGGIFFALHPRQAARRWINDVNPGLVSVYQALAERPAEFIGRCREIVPAAPGEGLTESGIDGGLPVNARLKAEFDRVKLNQDEDPAYRYFFVNRTVFGGRVNYDRPSRLYFSNPEGWSITEGRTLEQAAARLEGVRITCGDYAPLFQEPGENVWIYADPPYCRDTDLVPTSKLYQYSFTREDHVRLAEVVNACPHRVAISYDDTDFIRSLYDGFTILEASWSYCGTTKKEKDQGKELLILNYEPVRQRTFSFPEPTGETLTPPEAEAKAFHMEGFRQEQSSAFKAGAHLKAEVEKVKPPVEKAKPASPPIYQAIKKLPPEARRDLALWWSREYPEDFQHVQPEEAIA